MPNWSFALSDGISVRCETEGSGNSHFRRFLFVSKHLANYTGDRRAAPGGRPSFHDFHPLSILHPKVPS